MIGSILTGLAIFVAGLTIGWKMGTDFSANNILTEVTQQGFLNLHGVRYRVDRIGRKPRE